MHSYGTPTYTTSHHGAPASSPFPPGGGGSFASPQQRLTPPGPGSDPAQALMNEANWRWFQENAAFQERMGKRRAPDTLRHHVPVPVATPLQQSPAPPLPSMSTDARRYSGTLPRVRDGSPYPTVSSVEPTRGHHGLARGASRPSTASMSNIAPFVPEQPISSVSRIGRASHSGQFLTVSTPQSAAREEPAAWSQRPVDVPKHPYEAVHQATYGQQRERRSQHYIHQQQR